ncbi:DUF1365 domain-containing protein [Nakamurella lactea]|uniref:DUF1365 domain-containing protein n=1 Tax=Nakamurella lactea TaxID=459515 RepID=UPI0003FE1F51|nr:DUF1365 domain-containing protein [Nakamurella lactea]
MAEARSVGGGVALAAGGGPPWLYQAELGHVRTVPSRRAFSYRVYYWLVDLDELPRLPLWQRPLARFESRDHLGDPGRSIKENVTAFLAGNGIDLTGGRVLMLANARSFGHAFNPISVHWCYAETGELACILAEVHNTYRERHVYLLHPDPAGRVQQDKQFYVSPFLTVDGRYLMRFSPPGERLSITIALRQGGATVFTATLAGTRRPASTASLLRAVARRPAMTMLTSVWIRLQGVRLWAAGLPVVNRIPHGGPDDP